MDHTSDQVRRVAVRYQMMVELTLIVPVTAYGDEGQRDDDKLHDAAIDAAEAFRRLYGHALNLPYIPDFTVEGVNVSFDTSGEWDSAADDNGVEILG